jgi:hypothetical protein
MFRTTVVVLGVYFLGVQAAFALGWEQTEYLAVEPTGKVVKLSFDPSPNEEARGLMAYRAKNAHPAQHCLAEREQLDQPVQLRCFGAASGAPSERVYKPLDPTSVGDTEARRIYRQYLRGRKACGNGEYAGYLTCVQGCEGDRTKVLPKIEHTECVGQADAR